METFESALPDGLDLFKKTEVINSIDKIDYVRHRSTNPLDGDYIEIDIPATSEYIDFSKTTLNVLFKVKNSNGTNTTGGAGNNWLTEYALTSMWSKIEIHFNGVLVSPQTDWIPEKGILNLFNYATFDDKWTTRY